MAERQAVEQAVIEYVKVGVFLGLAIGIVFVACGPWVESNQHGRQRGWGVIDNLLAALIAVAVIADLIRTNASKHS